MRGAAGAVGLKKSVPFLGPCRDSGAAWNWQNDANLIAKKSRRDRTTGEADVTDLGGSGTAERGGGRS